MISISGIEKLYELLTEEEISKLNKSAARHKTESNITFKVLSTTKTDILIETIQNENKSGKYSTETTLINRTLALFSKILSGFTIIVHPVTFAPSPSSIVNTAWLETKMEHKGIRIKQIAFDTGIDRESISEWVTGKRSMSQIVKAMFYFYLSK